MMSLAACRRVDGIVITLQAQNRNQIKIWLNSQPITLKSTF